MTKNIGTDQTYLLNEQYKDSSNLDARAQLHAKYSVAEQEWQPWVFDHFTLPDDAHLLELGCGPCYLWRENMDRIPADWSITLSDFSAGMLAQAQENLGEAKSRFLFQQSDAQSIPVEDHSLDAVIANHMLYHVPDLSKALAEIRRVLKPNGRLLAATNGKNHLRQLTELSVKFVQAYAQDKVGNRGRPIDELTFRLDNGVQLLSPYFSNIVMHRYNSTLNVTAVEPLVAYLNSGLRYNLNESVNEDLRKFLTAKLESGNGAIHIDKDTGLFEASGPRL